jgi:hypothetical protein
MAASQPGSPEPVAPVRAYRRAVHGSGCCDTSEDQKCRQDHRQSAETPPAPRETGTAGHVGRELDRRAERRPTNRLLGQSDAARFRAKMPPRFGSHPGDKLSPFAGAGLRQRVALRLGLGSKTANVPLCEDVSALQKISGNAPAARTKRQSPQRRLPKQKPLEMGDLHVRRMATWGNVDRAELNVEHSTRDVRSCLSGQGEGDLRFCWRYAVQGRAVVTSGAAVILPEKVKVLRSNAPGSDRISLVNRWRASRNPSATLCGMPLRGVTIVKRISPLSGRASVTLHGRSSE